MTVDLMAGAIGVSGNQSALISLAAKHRFESVEARPHDLAKLSDPENEELLASMKEKGLAWGASGTSQSHGTPLTPHV